MYEVELRALVQDHESIKNKLREIAQPINENQKEVTIFFINPHKEGFDLRLRLQKNKTILSFKEGLSKTARKELETTIENPKTTYHLLLESGFKIRMIVARIKHNYKHEKFDILLNKVLHWGDAVEVERTIENKEHAEQTEKEIAEFIINTLKIPELLPKEKMLEMNNKYNNEINFDAISIQDLIDYVQDIKEDISFI